MAASGAKDIIKRLADEEIEFVDLKFTDLFREASALLGPVSRSR